MAEEIIGRDPEIASLAAFLDAARSEPTSLMLEGLAGIGKTTLWKWARGEARRRGFEILSSRPAESEASLSFAGLSDLLGAVLDGVTTSLPEPQARALDVALLRSEPEDVGADRRAVSAATLEAVRVLAGRGPVLIAVDDVQWLDVPSARVLEFAVRRLTDEPVGVLVAARAGLRVRGRTGLTDALGADRAQRLTVGPLSLAAVHQIVRSRLDLALPRSTLFHLYEASGGNPLFALELARALADAGGGPGVGETLPVPESLRQLMGARLARLPPGTREALLAAAALSSPTVPLVAEAIGPEADPDWLDRAIAGEVLLVESEGIRFTHPLLASVVYAGSPPGVRRRMHRRLADVAADLEERARHLALASEEPDSAVAAALEEAGRRAAARTATDTAAELFELATRLTPPSDTTGARRRLIDAATSREVVGDIQRARELLERAADEWPPGPDRARAMVVLARTEDSDTRGADLLARAQAEAEGNPVLAASIGVSRAWNVLFGRFDPVEAGSHARRALAAAEGLGDEWLLGRSLCVAGVVDFLLGGNVAIDLLERAVRLERDFVPLGVVRQPTYCMANAMRWMDDFEGARERLESLRRLALDLGTDASLYDVLFELCELECWAGRYEVARRHAEEMGEVAAEVGWTGSWAACAQAMVEAHAGRVEEARSVGARTLEMTSSQGDTRVEVKALAALGFLELSLGQPAAARPYLDRAALLAEHVREPGVMRFAADHVEALVGVGALDEAGKRLRTMEAQTAGRDRPWARATSARCRGLLLAASGDLDQAGATLDRALEAHGGLPMPLERGRTLLLQGEVWRRMRRKAAAREPLEGALEIFEQLSAAAWAERARSAIRRLGLRPPAPLDLTETERRVADLAAAGRTNRQIAEALFVSPKTVEANLARVYRKLGVGSKAQLASVVASRREAPS